MKCLKNSPAGYSLKKILNCPVCNQKYNDESNEIYPSDNNTNFYIEAIVNDFKLDLNELNKKIKIIKCGNCYSTYYSKWFDSPTYEKIFSTVYGQHNYGWQNYYNFIYKNHLPNHGDLFDRYFLHMDVKTYGELNCPYSGLYFDIFQKEYKTNLNFKKNIDNTLKKYFSSRQVSKKLVLKKEIDPVNKITMVDILNLKTEHQRSGPKLKKYLLSDFSPLCWGYNCISESVNCKAHSNLLFGLENINISNGINNLPNFDCFGFFMVLDHIKKPMKILNLILEKSRYVILHLHTSNTLLTKQHLFSFSKDFSKYLKTIKISNLDITQLIKKDNSRNKGKNYLENQIYMICSKSESLISSIK